MVSLPTLHVYEDKAVAGSLQALVEHVVVQALQARTQQSVALAQHKLVAAQSVATHKQSQYLQLKAGEAASAVAAATKAANKAIQ